MKKFVCQVCGYVYEGEAAPEFCPQCKAPASKFVEQVEGKVSYATEHLSLIHIQMCIRDSVTDIRRPVTVRNFDNQWDFRM